MHSYNTRPIVWLFVLLFLLGSCEKYVNIPPPLNQLTQENVFTNEQTIDAVVTGMYAYAFGNSIPLSFGTELYGGMAADDFYDLYGFYDQYSNNAYTPKDDQVSQYWSNSYKTIYQANDLILNLSTSSVISSNKKAKYIAEAKFFRGFSHFLLANFFGDVPLMLTTDVTQTALAPRTGYDSVMRQVMTDLNDAAAGIGTDNPNTRVTLPAITALQARVLLYQQDWAGAELKSTQSINSGAAQLETDLNRVFLATSTESIFHAPTHNNNFYFSDGITTNGQYFVPVAGSAPGFVVTDSLLHAFETGDNRKTSWIGVTTVAGQTYYYPDKYKQGVPPDDPDSNEDYVIFRLAEQYLIRAEARAQQNNIHDAIDDLNVLRVRAGLTGLPYSLSQAALLAAVEQERRVELFAEWGHRWFDLKRTGRADAVLGAEKPATWRPVAVLWPVPFVERSTNPNLTQNPGY